MATGARISVARMHSAAGHARSAQTATIDTREEFQDKRLELASNVWRTMKGNDSHECRNCHDEFSMDFGAQESRSADRHEEGFDDGKTCIDCHRGIAHELPEGASEAYAVIAAEHDN